MSKFFHLHNHALDWCDAQNSPVPFCKKMAELGFTGFALTQHGTLAGVEPMRAAAAKCGLKFVPGIETYYGNDGDILKNQHLVLLSLDYTGYMAIAMAVSDSQNEAGYSVMNDDILNKYFGTHGKGHGHVVALSACIQGPLAMELRWNETINHEIEKKKNRYKNVTDGSKEIVGIKECLAKIAEEIAEKKEKRDAAKKLSETKFAAREKRVAKLEAKSDPQAESAREELERDKQAAKDAKPVFEELKKEVSRLLAKQTTWNKELKELQSRQERFDSFNAFIKEAESKKRTHEEMRENVCSKIDKFTTLFGKSNFYVELQNHGIDKEEAIYPVLAKIAREKNVPVVATNDVHIIDNSEDERLRRQILRSLRFGTDFEEEHEGDAELYIKTECEMCMQLLKILPEDVVEEAMNNTEVIMDRCDVVFPEGEKHYPKFPCPEGKTPEDVLMDAVKRGIKWRFPNGMDKAHEDRLSYELDVIKKMDVIDYHLIVRDFLEYARVLAPVPSDMLDLMPYDIEEAKEVVELNGWQVGISVGPGRGSAVGSLVCYLIGITSMDPLSYDLLFERYLNPERVTMPDIDVDLSRTVRQKTIRYVQHKYGDDAVCGIMTTNAQAPRGAIRIAAKFYGLKLMQDGTVFYNLGSQMAKAVPGEPGTSFATTNNDGVTLYDQLCDSFKHIDHALNILKWAKIIEGSFTTYGAHAAGIVISDNKDVKEYLPLRWNKELNEWTTQCDKEQVEEKGLLKMDFLGLKTLDVITGTLKAVHKRTGKVIEPLEIPLDDEEVFTTIFQAGQTNSVFQFESSGMKSMLKRFKPSSFNDLILLVAAYRPGPLQYLDDVIDVKCGKKPISYATPELESILNVTYGYPIYQEQVMAIFQKLAGYTLGGADLVRRFMSKKKMDKLVKEREAFVHGDKERGIDGCVARGINEKVANDIFDQMTEFAKYAFNKSHATAYALNAYWTGYLKCHYPAEFLMEAMNWTDSIDKIKGLMRETKNFGIAVLAPDINRSEAKYAVVDGKILYGLGAVKSVGSNAEEIIEERKNGQFTSLKNFFLRTSVKKNAVENLVKAGAFDAFSKSRQAMLTVIEPYKDLVKKYLEKASFVNDASLILPEVDSLTDENALLERQKDFGISILCAPTTSEKLEKRIENAKSAAEAAMEEMNSLIVPSDMEEDWHERLNAEHEMLGAYVTGHPLDEYDLSSIKATPISLADTNTTAIFGIITDISLKNRKSDGKPMAFLTVEDKSAEIDVCVFCNEYVACAKYLKVGTAVEIYGKAEESDSNLTDENGDPIIVLKFYAKKMAAPKPAKMVALAVSSYAVFHVTKEAEFRQKYEDPDGCRFAVYDQCLDQMREMNYRVSEDAII